MKTPRLLRQLARPGATPLRHGVLLLAAGGILALPLCAYGLIADKRAFGAAWLAAWWFWAGLALGAQATLWMQRLTGGRWLAPIADTLSRLRAGTPALAILILPVFPCLRALYPWARPDWVDAAKETVFRGAWLQPSGFMGRIVIYVLLWSVLACLDGRGGTAARRQGYAAAGLALYAVSISLAAVDLLMSLTPPWYSTAFGLVVLVAQLKMAMAAAAYRGARIAAPETRGDLGNLLLMYVLTWSYIAFTQFQIIWAENLPAEISWYLPRVAGPWAGVALGLALLGLALPLAVLLSRGFKRDAACLRGLSLLLLMVGACEIAWWIFPSIEGLGGQAAWMTVLAWLGMGLLVRGAVMCFPARLPPAPSPSTARPEQEADHA
ncbi:hypothetical protein CAL29_15185 [Bordetella genomosp. 10]|uniref:Quinol:cytochrome c oxidoreductase quinone-binding subunit 2 n=1 Tax=Bordetella genomosp. 10 TaxID=1416804 RepID=A0A261SBN3_9BORD|nr:hypothetical protein [Bordetella genomosp. 10]OZI34809.1 hypothetical protein CAL29_15185 [Bordetella genomosp. 10]